MLRRLALTLRPLGAIAGVVLMTALIAPPAFADRGGDKGDRIENHSDGGFFENDSSDSGCNGRQEFDHTEQKICPATPHRPPTIVTRTCCKNPAGKVHCPGFRQCPNHSPS